MTNNITLTEYLSRKILPAVTIEDADRAVNVARAIFEGGLNVMEVPLRTEAAFQSIKAIRAQLPDIIIGAGTILTVAQLEQAKAAGAQFGLAPGFNPTVVRAAAELNLPFIPGVMTPSEIEQALELSCTVLKLFPVEQIGGIKMLKALAGPYGHTGVKFIPMGGVTPENMRDYLSQKNVIAIGGSWLASKELIRTENYNTIKNNIEEALALT